MRDHGPARPGYFVLFDLVMPEATQYMIDSASHVDRNCKYLMH